MFITQTIMYREVRKPGHQLPQSWKKISVITDISILRFYGYIGDISADIWEKILVGLKLLKTHGNARKTS